MSQSVSQFVANEKEKQINFFTFTPEKALKFAQLIYSPSKYQIRFMEMTPPILPKWYNNLIGKHWTAEKLNLFLLMSTMNVEQRKSVVRAMFEKD